MLKHLYVFLEITFASLLVDVSQTHPPVKITFDNIVKGMKFSLKTLLF